MLSLMNGDHQSSPTMANADAFHHQPQSQQSQQLQQIQPIQPSASASQQSSLPLLQPQPEPQPSQRRYVNDENVEPRQRNIPVPVLVRHEEYAGASAMLQVSLSSAGGDQSGEESSSSMRSSSHDRGSKRPREKRSTKSKCPPGLRSGKWTPEEEAFTNMIIYYFKLGRLHVEDGTSLRWYLAKRLNCEAMRVTKKLKGNSSIGKQIFRALEDTDENRRAIEEADAKLGVVEKAFVDSLTATNGGQPVLPSNPSTSSSISGPLPSQAAILAAQRKRSSPHKPMGLPKPPHLEAKKLVIPKVRNSLANSEDAKLLLHFFVEAHDPDPSVEKKRLFSDVDSSSSQTDDSPANKRRSMALGDLVDAV